MRRTGWLVLVGALGAVCVGGCSSSPTVEPTAEALATSVCDLGFRCCDRGELDWFLGPYVAQETCVERLLRAGELRAATPVDLEPVLGEPLQLPNLAALDRALNSGRVKVDDEALETCLAFLDDHACNEPLEGVDADGCVAPEPPEESPCEPELLFEGKVGEGGTCTSGIVSLECEAGLTCRTSSRVGVEGECVPVGQVGDFCFDDTECDPDLYCSQLDGTCKDPGQEGEPCLFAERESLMPDPSTVLLRCDSLLSCDPVTDTCVAACERGAQCSIDAQCDEERDLTCIMGRCDVLREEGLPCGDTDDCVDGLLCASDPEDPTRTLCTRGKAAGEPCSSHVECDTGFCDPMAGECRDKLADGELCPTGLDAQCQSGACDTSFVSCTSDDDCVDSGSCDLTTNRCEPYCAERLPAGAMCAGDSECVSGACIADICRELPLGRGEPCELASHCETEFCSLDDEPVCKELPLSNGERCETSSQCESMVCFARSLGDPPVCVTGAGENEPCGSSDMLPCDPSRFFCDTSGEGMPRCAPFRETGEECESAMECRGSCATKFNRMLCTPAAPPDAVVCDGS